MGRTRKWTPEKVAEDAKKYSTRGQWLKASAAAYQVSLESGNHDKNCEHMGKKCILSRGTITKEYCHFSASKYQTLVDWKKGDISTYLTALRMGWAAECSQHMAKPSKKSSTKKINKKWDLESCQKIASQFRSKAEWQKKHQASYRAAHRKGFLDECVPLFKTMPFFKVRPFFKPMAPFKVRPKLTKDECIASASRFTTIYEWRKGHYAAYSDAQKQGFYKDCSNLIKRNFINKHLEEVRGSGGRLGWCKKNRALYYTAACMKILNDMCDEAFTQNTTQILELNESIPTNQALSIDQLRKIALKYRSQKSWRVRDPVSFGQAKSAGMGFCAPHFRIKKNLPTGRFPVSKGVFPNKQT